MVPRTRALSRASDLKARTTSTRGTIGTLAVTATERCKGNQVCEIKVAADEPRPWTFLCGAGREAIERRKRPGERRGDAPKARKAPTPTR
jgi:hypothetical protein